MELRVRLSYSGDAVGCFDPGRVTAKVGAWFPDAEFDPTESAARRRRPVSEPPPSRPTASPSSSAVAG